MLKAMIVTSVSLLLMSVSVPKVNKLIFTNMFRAKIIMRVSFLSSVMSVSLPLRKQLRFCSESQQAHFNKGIKSIDC